MLIDDLCALRPTPGTASPTEPATTDERLDKARRRASIVVALDWLALLVLLFMRSGSHPWLSFGPQEETIFSLGVIAVAIHSGFRLGQLEKLRRVARILDEIDERSPSE